MADSTHALVMCAIALGMSCSVAAEVAEPGILSSAARWFDASSPSYYETDAQGNVTKILDRRGLGHAMPLSSGKCATVGTTNGVPAFLFGPGGSGVDYEFLVTNGCHMLFCVVDIEQSANAWLGGSDWCVDLERGANGEYGSRNLARAKTGVYNAGLRVADPGQTVIPRGKQLISVVMTPGDAAFSICRLAQSGNKLATSGGRALSEFIVYGNYIGVAHRTQVEKYLIDKWGIETPPVTLSGEIVANEILGEVYNGDVTLASGASLCIGSISSHSGGAVFGCRGRLTLTDPTLVVTGTVSMAGFASGRSYPIVSWGAGSNLTLASFDLTDFRCVDPPPHQKTEFVVEGNALCARLVGVDGWTVHDLEQGPLAAEDGGKYIVSGSTDANVITVAAHANVQLLLDTVTISKPAGVTPFTIGAGATANVELLNVSAMSAADNLPAIALDPDGASLEFGGVGNGKLNVYAGLTHSGIYVPTGSFFTMGASNATLFVQGAAKNGANSGAAVGGARNVGSGTITVNAGVFSVYGANESAAIGVGLVNGETPPDVGPITINGGTVTAHASSWASGIGGGVAYNTRGADMTSFTMNGGSLAVNGVQAVAIGGATGGRTSSGCRGGILRRFKMTGGTISARTSRNTTDLPSNFACAVIGGGPSRNEDCAVGGGAELIEITGGTITVNDGEVGIGVGGNVGVTTSYAAGECAVVVSAGVVNAKGSICGIGGIVGTEAHHAVTITGGAVYAPDGIAVRPTNGAVGLSEVPVQNGTLSTFEVPGTPGYTYKVPTTANSDGIVHLWLPPGQATYGDIDWIIDSRDEAISYTLDARRLFMAGVCTNVTVNGSSTNSIAVQSGAKVALALNGLQAVSATHSALTLEGTAQVALNLLGANRLENTGPSPMGAPGVRVAYQAALRIDGTGSLTARGGYKGAGIGNGAEYDSGAVTIDGGTVVANGGGQAAGIGCGCRDGVGTGTCGPVVINGGTVTAMGGGWAAGIGGATAYNSDGGRLVSFTMNGGTAMVTGNNAAGLGGGSGGAGFANGKDAWEGGTVGSITLNGGDLRVATSVNSEAPGLVVPAIGGGGNRNDQVAVSAGGGEITINGGCLRASGGQYGIGAGGTQNGTTSIKNGVRTNVRINDGTIEVSGSVAAIGGPDVALAATTNVESVVIRGGSVKFSGALQIAPTVGDDNATPVYSVPVRKSLLRSSPLACEMMVKTVSPAYEFNYHGTGHEDDDNVYFWLPNGRHLRGDGLYIAVNGADDVIAGYTGAVIYVR